MLTFLFLAFLIFAILFMRESKKRQRVESEYELFRTVIDNELKHLPYDVEYKLRKAIDEYVDFNLPGPGQVRTIPIKKSIRNHTLADVLHDPLPFPDLNKKK